MIGRGSLTIVRRWLLAAGVALLSLEGTAEMAKGLKFSTQGIDCWVDGDETNAVETGECYALVWKAKGATFDGLPMRPPNPDDPYALGNDVWLVDYFPVAELDAKTGRMRCPEVLFSPGDLPLWETQNGTWTVYLLDTRYQRADGTIAWGFDRAVTNAPRRINAYMPVPGLVDFKVGTTLGPAWEEKVGGFADGTPVVADEKTEPNQVDVTFDAQGGTCAEVSRTHMYGDDYGELPVATREGYEFSGWFTQPLSGERVTPTTIATSNATVYAQWLCEVTFDACGGETDEGSRTVTAGAPLGTPPSATRRGYVLDGWYTSAEDGEKIDATSVATAATTYFAHWTPNRYVVRFDANDGEGEMDDVPMTWGAEATLPTNEFSRVGYQFSCWHAEGGEWYADGATVSNLTDVADGTNVLCAVWDPNRYTVVFDANNGSGETYSQDFRYDEFAWLEPNWFEDEKYAFAGWATSPAGEVEYWDEEEVWNLTDEPDGVVTLYAVWTEREVRTLCFWTWDGDCYADGEPVLAGECYALVWVADGASLDDLPLVPPAPGILFGEGVKVVRYFPVAENEDGWSRCPEVWVEGLSLEDETSGSWTVCLLDTRYFTENGAIACGFDESTGDSPHLGTGDRPRSDKGDRPRCINAYAPIAGLTGFNVGTAAKGAGDVAYREGWHGFADRVTVPPSVVPVAQFGAFEVSGECVRVSVTNTVSYLRYGLSRIEDVANIHTQTNEVGGAKYGGGEPLQWEIPTEGRPKGFFTIIQKSAFELAEPLVIPPEM